MGNISNSKNSTLIIQLIKVFYCRLVNISDEWLCTSMVCL